ncbi:hypothetical protein KQI41_00660 [Tissierella pigra]|uniref:Zinc ribbon domain-containing protein n=1 Tax=Tissierella pigra TaxID=2607614 RepID=A0A6N7XTQ6_9FIRM|nr:DUF6320 domain-containing protein [Tissierella pigra]MBU5424904.1 hypothetical protein [Tissierella pigra]MSU01157.1 hypothetical protein [Tissierella pigra]
MNYCSHCEVKIRGEQEKCPLCGNMLSDNHHNHHEKIFPNVLPYYEKHLAIRILLFISIATVVVSFSINIIFPSNINWPLLLVFALVSIWLGVIALIQRRYHIAKKIVRQVCIISLLAIFWDWRIGWKGWSLDYVIPITCVTAMITMYIIAQVMKLSTKEYITYTLIDGLFGIIPILFFIFGWINVIYPTIICVTLSIISVSAIFIFRGKDIKVELDKRMHI